MHFKSIINLYLPRSRLDAICISRLIRSGAGIVLRDIQQWLKIHGHVTAQSGIDSFCLECLRMHLRRVLHIGSLRMKHLLKLRVHCLIFNHRIQLLVKRFIQNSSCAITGGDGEL